MKCGSNLWFLLFAPGKNEGMASGFTTSQIPRAGPPLDHFEEWEAAVAAEAEKDREMAEIFDKKLVDEVSRLNIVGVYGMKKLAGWEAAYAMKSSLQEAQLAEAMFSLPPDHPYFAAYLRGFSASLKSLNR